MPVESVVVTCIVVAGYIAFMGALAWAAWYSKTPDRRSGATHR